MSRNQKVSLTVLAIFATALLLRISNIHNETIFGGDQGYDFLQIKSILEGNLTLLGPKIGPYNELGNLYLGPAYYYILLPSLYLFKLDPVGPAYLTALLSAFTVILIFKICSMFLSKRSALTAALLFAISPFIIIQSKTASNPHLIPFFSSLAIYALLRPQQKNSKNNVFYMLVTGVCIGIMFQLHYLSISLLLASAFFLLFNKQIKNTGYLLASFLVGISPQILFEIKHNFFVTNLFLAQLRVGNALSLKMFYQHIAESLSMIAQIMLNNNKQIALILAALFFFVLKIDKNKQRRIYIQFFCMFFVLTIFITSMYKGKLETHYFAQIYPVIFILVAYATGLGVLSKSLIARATSGVVLLFLIVSYTTKIVLHVQDTEKINYAWNLNGQKIAALKIAGELKDGEKFNVATTISGDTRSMPIRFLLSSYGKQPLGVENYPEAEAIYLISNDDEKHVALYTVWEVSSYAPFTIANLEKIQGNVNLYKLTKK